MRAITLVALLAAGCGDNRDKPVVDAAPDAPPPPRCTPTSGTKIELRHLGKVGGTVVIVTAPPGDRDRLFAAVEAGYVKILVGEDPLTSAQDGMFLDISELGGELPFTGYNFSEVGLLGLAFHPNYATNGFVYLMYTAYTGVEPEPYRDVVMRYTTSATNPDRIDPDSGVVILAIPDFAANHNGGMLAFGPDGYLYISTGDGGASNDPEENGQDTQSLLGKILRIDVDGQQPYSVPTDNPFGNEVWMLGLRNPWRFTFDDNGDFWIGDVGQEKIEEIDRIPFASSRGANFGWKPYEGSTCLHPPCDPAGMTFPVVERTHAEGFCALIGGAVYRGTCMPDLVGDYFYADNCVNGISRLSAGATTSVDTPIEWFSLPASINPVNGELYVGDVWGNVFRLEARRATSSTVDSDTARTSQ